MKIKIKEEIVKRIQKRVKETKEFKNIGEYINYVLKQVIERLDKESSEKKKEAFPKKDEEKLRERLNNLGYLD